MPTQHSSRLPDPVYGCADVNPTDNYRLRITTSEDLIHVFAGGIYLAMTERGWQQLFAAMETIDIEKSITHDITLDDTAQTAAVVTS